MYGRADGMPSFLESMVVCSKKLLITSFITIRAVKIASSNVNSLITICAPGCFRAGRHFAYRHILVAVSTKMSYMFEKTVLRELKDVSRNIA